jgi:selenocysteine-specific elongation factor
VRETIAARGELTVADLKDRLGVSRKFAVPLLEHLDRLGVTRRKGDVRVAGALSAAPTGAGEKTSEIESDVDRPA